MNSLERLRSEFKDLNRHPIVNMGITVSLLEENNWYEWKATILGAKETSYIGGLFYIKLLFPQEYPNKGPDIIFLTPIYHLNVNHKFTKYFEGCELLGHVSANFINWWKPETTVREMLTKLFAVFYWPNPDYPYDLDRAIEYRENRQLYELKVKYFTKKYASPLNKFKYKDQDWDFSYDEKNLEPFKLKVQKENEKKNGKEKEKEEEEEEEEDQKNNNDDIILFISDNGGEIKKIQCGINELIKDVIQRCMNKYGISENLEEALVIFLSKRLNMNLSVKDSGLGNNCTIDIINDVIFGNLK